MVIHGWVGKRGTMKKISNSKEVYKIEVNRSLPAWQKCLLKNMVAHGYTWVGGLEGPCQKVN